MVWTDKIFENLEIKMGERLVLFEKKFPSVYFAWSLRSLIITFYNSNVGGW